MDDGRFVAVLPLSFSLFLPNPLPCTTATARSRPCRILHRTIVKSSPEMLRGHGRDEELDADGPAHPSKPDLASKHPQATTTDLQPLRILPSP